MNLAQTFYSLPDDQRDEWYYQNVVKGNNDNKFIQQVKDYFKKGNTKFYAYMLTFTLDPKRHAFSERYYDNVEKYIKKRLKTDEDNCLFQAIVREGGDEDHKHTHWHVCYVRKTYIDSRIFDYYKTLYGNYQIDPTKVKNQFETTLKYMSKQRAFTTLLGNAFRNNLDPKCTPENPRKISSKLLM